ncbi:MAG: hypothetical protein KGN39_09285 [Betaproteobacteria bacterium]|nr:hypothetical protein [Betaproteobacteria bacterium]
MATTPYRQSLRESAARLAALPSDAPTPPADARLLPPLDPDTDALGLRLWLAADTDRIQAARFTNVPEADRDWLEILARLLPGLSLEEAAAQGAAYAFHLVSREAPSPADRGILNPIQECPALGQAQTALRAYRQRCRPAGETPALSGAAFLALPETWAQTTPEARLARLRQVVLHTLQARNLAPGLLEVDRLEDDIRGRPVRVILNYEKSADSAELPALMRTLEKALRHQAAPWLEVYGEERVDRNALRRTILVDQRKA